MLPVMVCLYSKITRTCASLSEHHLTTPNHVLPPQINIKHSGAHDPLKHVVDLNTI